MEFLFMISKCIVEWGKKYLHVFRSIYYKFLCENISFPSLTGHYGTGKTLLATEVLKIWKGRFHEHNKEVDLIALTFDGGGLQIPRAYAIVLNYHLLN